MDVLSIIIGIIGILLSTIGLWLTVKSNRMIKKSKTIDWSQFQIAVK